MPVEIPQPKHEIVISKLWKDGDQSQVIETFSDDARRWIVEQAPQFGQLDIFLFDKLFAKIAKMPFDDNLMTAKMLQLDIAKCYDPADVVKYLVEGYQQS